MRKTFINEIKKFFATKKCDANLKEGHRMCCTTLKILKKFQQHVYVFT